MGCQRDIFAGASLSGHFVGCNYTERLSLKVPYVVGGGGGEGDGQSSDPPSHPFRKTRPY